MLRATWGAILGSSRVRDGMRQSRSGGHHHSALYDATLAALIFIDLLSAVPGMRRADVLRDANILDRRQAILL